MLAAELIVSLDTGLHIRLAALLVQIAGRYVSDIWIQKDTKKINAKSIMGVMSLGVNKGDKITIIADGRDEKQALDAIRSFVTSDGKDTI